MRLASVVCATLMATLQPSRNETKLEVWTIVVLGLVSLVTAWAAFQSSLWSGVATERFARADARRTAGVVSIDTATGTVQEDRGLFVEYYKALSDKNTAVAGYIEVLMPKRLSDAVDQWEKAPNHMSIGPVPTSLRLPAARRQRRKGPAGGQPGGKLRALRQRHRRPLQPCRCTLRRVAVPCRHLVHPALSPLPGGGLLTHRHDDLRGHNRVDADASHDQSVVAAQIADGTRLSTSPLRPSEGKIKGRSFVLRPFDPYLSLVAGGRTRVDDGRGLEVGRSGRGGASAAVHATRGRAAHVDVDRAGYRARRGRDGQRT